MSVEVNSEGYDLGEVKTFYNPHPGFGGAIIPLPSAIKQVVDDLAGQQVTLQEAIDKVKLSVVLSNMSLVEIRVRESCLLLKVTEKNGRLHIFKLISYQ